MNAYLTSFDNMKDSPFYFATGVKKAIKVNNENRPTLKILIRKRLIEIQTY